MAKYQIASGSGRGFDVRLYINSDTDPSLDISLNIKEINRVAGYNKIEIPVGHLQNEYQVHIIDFNNTLWAALKDVDITDTIVEIDRAGSNVLTGNATLKTFDRALFKSADVKTLLCDDGLIHLQKDSIGEAFWSSRYTFAEWLRIMISNASVSLPVKVAMGAFDINADSSGVEKAEDHRFNLQALIQYDKSIDYYSALIRFCEEFELMLFQEAGAYYIVDSYERALGLSSVLNTNTGAAEAVNFSRALSTSDFRRQEGTPDKPSQFHFPAPLSVVSKYDLDRSYTSVRNPYFNFWSDGNLYPLDWDYEDPTRFDRIQAPTPVKLRSEDSDNGLLVKQVIPVPAKPKGTVSIDFECQVGFGEDQSAGSIQLRLARIYAITDNGIYGLNPSTGEFDSAEDGWVDIEKTYPGTAETVTVDINIEATVVKLFNTSNIVIELYDTVIFENAGSITELPGFSKALIDIRDDADPAAIQPDVVGAGSPSIERSVYLSQDRRYYHLNDVQVYDGTDWLDADDWGDANDDRIDYINERRFELWCHDLRIIEVPVSSKLWFNLYDEVQVTIDGETINCIPLRIKHSAKNNKQNILRLLECSIAT